jgi:hypothetical protein
MVAMKHRLSSVLTLPWKLFPILWIGYGLFWLVYAFSNINILACLIYFLAGGFAYWMLGSLKSVFLSGNVLLVSNYLKTVEIPLSDVEYVSKPENSSHRRIVIQLRSGSVFGRKIIFMPQFFQADEIVEGLRDRVGVTRDRPDDSPIGEAEVLFIKRYRNLLKRKRN